MARSKSQEEWQPNPWKTAPRWSVAVFLLAVFFCFASFGFVFDGMNLGRQPAPRLAMSVVLVGLFAACYAVSGITLRRRFWMAAVPIFVLENASLTAIYNWMPDGPWLRQLNEAQLTRLHHRIVFDGNAIMVSVVLGYVGFLVVSISEARRRIGFQVEKAELETELSAAREIQRLMVPEKLPATPGYAIESIYRPASQVGGDFFQVLPLGGGRTLIVVGDVSGKGLSAAMIVSMLIGMLDAISRVSQEPAEILSELNGRLFARQHGGFVTCLAARLDPSGEVALANAGHLAPWLNGAELAFAGSLPLSVAAMAVPEQATVKLGAGDRLTLITDGIVEARDEAGILFGFDRTRALMGESFCSTALAEAAIHHGQQDDLTVLSVMRTE